MTLKDYFKLPVSENLSYQYRKWGIVLRHFMKFMKIFYEIYENILLYFINTIILLYSGQVS